MTMIATTTMRAMVMEAPVVGPGYAASYARRSGHRIAAMSAKQEAQEWAETVRKLRRAQRPHLRAGRRDQPQRRAGGALRRRRPTGSPASWSRASGAPAATPTKRRSAASSARRCCRPRCSPRPTCPTWPRSSPPSTSSRSRAHEVVTQHFARKVEFESIDFNKRFLATVPKRVRPGRAARAVQPRLPRAGRRR